MPKSGVSSPSPVPTASCSSGPFFRKRNLCRHCLTRPAGRWRTVCERLASNAPPIDGIPPRRPPPRRRTSLRPRPSRQRRPARRLPELMPRPFRLRRLHPRLFRRPSPGAAPWSRKAHVRASASRICCAQRAANNRPTVRCGPVRSGVLPQDPATRSRVGRPARRALCTPCPAPVCHLLAEPGSSWRGDRRKRGVICQPPWISKPLILRRRTWFAKAPLTVSQGSRGTLRRRKSQESPDDP